MIYRFSTTRAVAAGAAGLLILALGAGPALASTAVPGPPPDRAGGWRYLMKHRDILNDPKYADLSSLSCSQLEDELDETISYIDHLDAMETSLAPTDTAQIDFLKSELTTALARDADIRNLLKIRCPVLNANFGADYGQEWDHVHTNSYQLNGGVSYEFSPRVIADFTLALGDVRVSGEPAGSTNPGSTASNTFNGSHFAYLGQGGVRYEFAPKVDVGVFVGDGGIGNRNTVGGGLNLGLHCPQFAFNVQGGYFANNVGGKAWGGAAALTYSPTLSTALRAGVWGQSYSSTTLVPIIVPNPTNPTLPPTTQLVTERFTAGDYSAGFGFEQRLGKGPVSLEGSYRYFWGGIGTGSSVSIGLRWDIGPQIKWKADGSVDLEPGINNPAYFERLNRAEGG